MSGSSPSPQRTPVSAVLVVVPAHDEEERIAPCLTSVDRARQELARVRPDIEVTVTVILDRCTDRTADMALLAADVTLLTVDAGSVGAARRAGVAHAAEQLGRDPREVLVLNTDADCVVPPGWIARHVALAATHDLVLGEVEPEPTEMSAASLALWWDRHPAGQGALHGANLGVRLDAYLRAGGFPAVPYQEDVLLVRALRAQRAAVVSGPRIVTSGRREGRASQGFATYLVDLDRELEPDAPVGTTAAAVGQQLGHREGPPWT